MASVNGLKEMACIVVLAALIMVASLSSPGKLILSKIMQPPTLLQCLYS